MSTIRTVSVKVMRSYDYCHFEVCLTADSIDEGKAFAEADELRKQAARLADKAVAQYKIAKEVADRDPEAARARRERILAKSDQERTVEERAIIKSLADHAFALTHYDYQDDWDREDDDY